MGKGSKKWLAVSPDLQSSGQRGVRVKGLGVWSKSQRGSRYGACMLQCAVLLLLLV